MKILFITFDRLSLESSYLRRLLAQLKYFEADNQIEILSLSNSEEAEEIKKQYSRTNFYNHKPIFDGWYIVNLQDCTNYVENIVHKTNPDLVVLTVEIWDLMRSLAEEIGEKVPFATILHAMPFLVAPVYPSGNFERDVLAYVKTLTEQYKKKYILSHYKEIDHVFEHVSLIANNKTVAFYIETYFKNKKIWVQKPSMVMKNYIRRPGSEYKYDFVYMARMEQGKGVEYLKQITGNISSIMNRKITLAIAGRADDAYCKDVLNNLTEEHNELVEIIYLGWVGEQEKQELFNQSKVFLYPSHKDNFPTVVNEALSFGLPVITWNTPFSRLSYGDTKAVVRVPLLNVESFAQAAVEMYKNADAFSIYANDYINKFDFPQESAFTDMEIYSQIVKEWNGKFK